MLIPLLFMGDIVGRLFREFAITLSVTILVSAVVSLTLTPMMCSRLLKRKADRETGPFLRSVGARLSARHRLLRPDASMGVEASGARRCWWRWRRSVLTILLYIIVPKGFFPVQDTGVIQGISDARRTFPSPRWPRDSRRSRR